MLISGIEIQNGKLIVFKKNFLNGSLDNVDIIKDTIGIKDGNFTLEKTEIVESKRGKKEKKEDVEKIKKDIPVKIDNKDKFSID